MQPGRPEGAHMGKAKAYTHGGRRVVIDSETALWSMRMLIGEGWRFGKGEAVLMAMLNRFLNGKHKYQSFLSMIRLFSQPINDRWLPGGDKFKAAAKRTDAESIRSTSAEAVARRKRIRAMNWEHMPDKVKKIVLDFVEGNLRYPRRFGTNMYDNFASYEGVDRGRPGGIWYGREYFFEDAKSTRGKLKKKKSFKETNSGADPFIAAIGLYAVYKIIKGFKNV